MPQLCDVFYCLLIPLVSNVGHFGLLSCPNVNFIYLYWRGNDLWFYGWSFHISFAFYFFDLNIAWIIFVWCFFLYMVTWQQFLNYFFISLLFFCHNFDFWFLNEYHPSYVLKCCIYVGVLMFKWESDSKVLLEYCTARSSSVKFLVCIPVFWNTL